MAPVASGRSPTVYLDTETTGLAGDVRIVELAIVDDAGEPLLDTLLDPLIPIPSQATAIHGIGDDDVAGCPTLDELLPRIDAAIRGTRVVIYNVSYDQRLFPDRLAPARSVHCAMRRFKQLAVAQGRGNGTLARAAAWSGPHTRHAIPSP
jgi:DNA polymerase III alpha subunit (gram-positive type)